MVKKSLFILTAMLLLCAAQASAQGGKDLFEQKCISCHTLERSLEKSKSFEEWKRTAMRMGTYTFGNITMQDSALIARYLADLAAPEDPAAIQEIKRIAEIDQHEMFDFKKVRKDQFIKPETCKNCHSEIYNMWKGSMHSKAFNDPIWRAATKLFVQEAVTPGEILEMKACVKCHTPLGFRSYTINNPNQDYDAVAGLAAEGIFCNWCHNINELKHIGDAGYEVAPGGGEEDPSTMLGPLKDAYSNIHPTKYSELHTRSEFCGLCHDVAHAANGLPIENTYTEWKDSPYNTGNAETSVHCQDCHMRQKPGVPATGSTERPDNPGQASDYGPKRDHIWTHYFVGGNAVVTRLTGSTVNADMAVERLQHAAELEIIKSPSYGKSRLSRVNIKVINSGAGHYLPTGLTEVRQMWLDVKITDARGQVLLHSGYLDKDGAIEKDAVLYHTVLGDGQGNPVLNVAKAERILYDYRIPPKGYTLENYDFYVPADAASPLHVEVSLNYRSASQSLVDRLLGEDKLTVPTIEMVKATDVIGLQ